MSCIHKDSWQSRLYYKNVCGLNFHPPYSIRNASTHVCCCFCFLTCGCLSPCSFPTSHWVESPFWDDRQIWPRLTIKNHKISTYVHWKIAQINPNKKGFVQLWRSKFEVFKTLFIKSLFQVIGVSSFDVNITSRQYSWTLIIKWFMDFLLSSFTRWTFFQNDQPLLTFFIVQLIFTF